MPAKPRSRWALWLTVATVAAASQAINLLHVARAQGCDSAALRCSERLADFATPDTRSYVGVARSIRDQGFLAGNFTQRQAGYPLVLAASLLLFASPLPALWLNPLLAAAAAIAIAWLAASFTGKQGAGLAAGLLFACWPNSYQWSPLLLTDTPHALLAVCAFAATLRWRASEGSGSALAAGAAWLATQSLRPTFLALPLLLPLLLWKRSNRRYLALSLAIWLASCIAPAFQLIQNELRHGELLPAQAPHSLATLQCYASSRLRAEFGEGGFGELRNRCMDAKRLDPQATTRRERDYLLSRPGAAASSYAGEIITQMLWPLRPYYYPRQASFYPPWWWLGSGFMALYWLAAVGGWLLLLRGRRRDALFLAGVAAMILIPAGVTHWVGARIRFPLDLLFLPVVVLAATEWGTGLVTQWRLRRGAKRETDPVPVPGPLPLAPSI
jgi:hypothetical protein